MIMGMKKLLSLPSNLVDCFQAIEHVSTGGMVLHLGSVGARLGSGEERLGCWRPPGEKRPLMYPWRSGWDRRSVSCCMAGGQSRRLPGYAPSGKILTPIPVFRWARGQRLSQNLLSLQLPLYERIMKKAPESLHTLIASGDVYIRANQPLQEIPEVDVVCYGLWVRAFVGQESRGFCIEP